MLPSRPLAACYILGVARASIQLANGKFSKMPPKEEQDTVVKANIPIRERFASYSWQVGPISRVQKPECKRPSDI